MSGSPTKENKHSGPTLEGAHSADENKRMDDMLRGESHSGADWTTLAALFDVSTKHDEIHAAEDRNHEERAANGKAIEEKVKQAAQTRSRTVGLKGEALQINEDCSKLEELIEKEEAEAKEDELREAEIKRLSGLYRVDIKKAKAEIRRDKEGLSQVKDTIRSLEIQVADAKGKDK
mmetsp:Transcript_6067/g.13218  ORF Transcript_6067/g.13218 Transcript_6067/m.13218 type:complete len:176 (-) Transcript_6067:88-615(-)